MKSNHFALACSRVLVASALAGCFLQAFPLRSISVLVDNEGNTCLGGLKAQLERNDGVFYISETVPLGESSQEREDVGQGFYNDVGSPSITVTIRAWCYGAQGEEIGYAESVDTSLGTGSSETALVLVKPQADTESTGCELYSRGEPICL